MLLLTGAKHGMLGVAGMMKLLVMKWIIPSFPALSTSKIIDDCPSYKPPYNGDFPLPSLITRWFPMGCANILIDPILKDSTRTSGSGAIMCHQRPTWFSADGDLKISLSAWAGGCWDLQHVASSEWSKSTQKQRIVSCKTILNPPNCITLHKPFISL